MRIKSFFPQKSYKNEAFIEYNLNEFILKGDFLIEFYNNAIVKKV